MSCNNNVLDLDNNVFGLVSRLCCTAVSGFRSDKCASEWGARLSKTCGKPYSLK